VAFSAGGDGGRKSLKAFSYILAGRPVMKLTVLDRLPAGEWFVLDVIWKGRPKWDWAALMIDVDPDVEGWSWRRYRNCWVRIPGKHRNWEAACETLEYILATRH
jgi:hypothetical protein